MTYYFIGPDQERISGYQKRMPFLTGPVWISDMDDLEKALETSSAGDFFFVCPERKLAELDAYALRIKDQGSGAKLIFLSEEKGPQALKEHQLSSAGGDAYISPKLDPELLKSILEGLGPQVKKVGNKLETLQESSVADEMSDLTSLKKMKDNPISKAMDELFRNNLPRPKKSELQSSASFAGGGPGLSAASGDDEIPALDDAGEFDIGDIAVPGTEEDLDGGTELDLGGDLASGNDNADDEVLELGDDADEGISLSFDGADEAALEELGDDDAPDLPEEELEFSEDLDLGEGEELGLSEEDQDGEGLELVSDHTELDLGDDDAGLELGGEDVSLDLGGDDAGLDLGGDDAGLDLGGDDAGLELGGDEVSLELGESDAGVELGGLEDSAGLSLDAAPAEDLNIDFGGKAQKQNDTSMDLSEDAMAKLAEIDAIMETDATSASLRPNLEELEEDEDLDRSLVSDDLDLGSLDFSAEEEAPEAKKPKAKKKEPKEEVTEERHLGRELKEISGAWNGEMERTQATLANLRADREELLAKIQQLEEEKVLQNRQMLTVRAELDERKIELTIIRKKLNEEINELKDRLKLHDERRLILEEKNRLLMQELDKAGQKSKLDVKKVQMRERELEQKLELLKADSETQIRNRDLKILELKRKIDAMEFDMESISQQEKRSVESRFELEDKLDKAIKTLRTAISVLEDESQRGNALEALKKNIDV